MKRYKYVKGREKRTRFFWIGKHIKTKKTVENYMDGKIDYCDFYTNDGKPTVGLCSYSVLWHSLNKLKSLGLIVHV